MQARIKRIEQVKIKEVNSSQTFGRIKKGNYKNIILRNNLAPTQMRMDNFRETLKEIVVSKTRLQNNTTTNKAVSFQGRQTMESKDIEEIIRSRNQKNIFENGT